MPTPLIKGFEGLPERTLTTKVREKLLFIPATLRLVIAIVRRKPIELWIGDSNAMGTNHSVVSSMFMRGADGQFILRGGARLMYSITRDGWSPRIMRVVKVMRPFVRRGSVVPIFSAGEIDIRCHLTDRGDAPITFTDGYVERCEEVVRLLKAKRSGYLWPPPQCAQAPDDVWFPMVGSLPQRLANADRLRTALGASIEQVPHASLLDFTDILASPENGGIRRDLTDDGVHTNLAAVAVIRAALPAYGLHELRAL